ISTLIHVVGLPMAGYHLEFKRLYSPWMTNEPNQQFVVGRINAQLVHDWIGARETDQIRGNIE
ncbi:hypothetical protein K505DRAFT_261786, partial [Melanomma pulvis-pyrius CBS 109.77]